MFASMGYSTTLAIAIAAIVEVMGDRTRIYQIATTGELRANQVTPNNPRANRGRSCRGMRSPVQAS